MTKDGYSFVEIGWYKVNIGLSRDFYVRYSSFSLIIDYYIILLVN